MDVAPVLVADGDNDFRSSVAELLERAGLTALTASTGEEAIDAARARRPSVIVLDVELQDRSGYETCRELRELYGESLPILFVSAERTEPYDRVAGLLLGGDDYLPKPADPDELLARILRAARRASAVGDPRPRPAPSQPRGGVPPLTRRELEILSLMALAQSPSEIATSLVISPKTVASHLQRILSKLAVHSRTQAVARAYELGLVRPIAQHAPAAPPDTPAP